MNVARLAPENLQENLQEGEKEYVLYILYSIYSLQVIV